MQMTSDLFARKNELEVIALTRKIEGKRARGRQQNMFLNRVSFACGNRWTGVEILKMCQRREEHQLIANVRFWWGTTTGHGDSSVVADCIDAASNTCCQFVGIADFVIASRFGCLCNFFDFFLYVINFQPQTLRTKPTGLPLTTLRLLWGFLWDFVRVHQTAPPL